ncbi:ROK family transcriptional regulator [Cryobacterium mannosilyticum]|uniref:ROK family transcriptional regulator n=1 Tax=Cryobacterium mannosilyticum TaxID=1259190 RepID=A0A4R8WEQ6_9MICO|nr:ROK family transcriptional regulator [Cryobacterium mannosilyticum]TFC05234.1 ROK family transcriptional regulator [Cryobacterium mannosilyticum]
MVQDTKEINRATVITELLRSRPTSRGQIAQVTGISAATVSRAVDQLISEGLVREVSALVSESRGRRPVLLDLEADTAHVVGVDLGASNTRFAIVDLLGSTVVEREIRTPADFSPAKLGEWVVAEVREAAGDMWNRIQFSSVGLPGAVSQDDGSVSNASNLAQVEDRRFLDALESSFGIPVEIDNDVNYALLGEQHFGVASQYPTAAMLTLGAGLGAGLAIEGTILHGRRGLVGEFGHLPIGPLGTRLEHLVTGPGILRKAAEAGVTLADPAELFVSDPSNAITTLRGNFDHALLIVLTAITVSCEPEIIVLGGGIAKSLASSLTRYEDALRQNLHSSPKLVLPGLGDMSGAVGAAVSGLHRAYRELGVSPDALTSLPVVTPSLVTRDQPAVMSAGLESVPS